MINRLFGEKSGFQVIWMFYAVSLCELLFKLNAYTYTNFNIVADTPRFPFVWIPAGFELNPLLSFVCPILMTIALMTFGLLNHQWARIVWFCFHFLVDGFHLAYILGHESHMYVWISFYLALIPGDLREKQENDSFFFPYIRACHLQIILIYAIAGVWKLRSWIMSVWDPNISAGTDFVRYSLAHEWLNSNAMQASALWVFNNPGVATVLSLMVMVSQIGSVFVFPFAKYFRLWGLVLALFHVGTLFSVSVFFRWSVPPIVMFLIMKPMAEESTFGPFIKAWKSRAGVS